MEDFCYDQRSLAYQNFINVGGIRLEDSAESKSEEKKADQE